MDFQAEMKKRFKKIEEDIYGKPKKKVLKAKPTKPKEKLFNVWKLSIPSGHFKKPVMLNIPESEARKFVHNAGRTRTVSVKGCDTHIIVFYEMYPADDKDPNIYKNPTNITKENKHEVPKIEIVRDQDVTEPRWQG